MSDYEDEQYERMMKRAEAAEAERDQLREELEESVGETQEVERHYHRVKAERDQLREDKEKLRAEIGRWQIAKDALRVALEDSTP